MNEDQWVRWSACLNRILACAIVTAAALLSSGSARAGTVPWYDFNVVSLGNFSTGNDVEGTVFVGGNLSSQNPTQIASNTSVTYPATQDTLQVVGNIASGSTVHMTQGSLVYGGSIAGTTITYNGGGSGSQNLSQLQMEASSLKSQLTSVSSAYSALATTGSTLSQPGPSDQPAHAVFTAVAGANGVAVFDINASFFSNTKIQAIDLDYSGGTPVTSIVINVSGSGAINTSGTTLNFEGNWLNNSVEATTIWNFAPTITSVTLSDAFSGAILAPDASVTTGNTQVDGSIFAASIVANGEIHIPYFDGFIPSTAVPEPSSIAMSSFWLVGAAILAARRRAGRIRRGR
jgi:choice-of-anchor A domain-containing protein